MPTPRRDRSKSNANRSMLLDDRELVNSLERAIESMRQGKGTPFEEVAARIYRKYIRADGTARRRSRKST